MGVGGVLAGGGGVPRGGKHPPRPALRTLIVSGGRRRPRRGPCAFTAPGSWLLVTPTIAPPPPPPTTAPRVTARGAGGRVRAYCSLAFPLAVYVFSWEPSVWSGACIAAGGGWLGGGRPRRPAPSRAQEGGREHPRRGRPPGPASPPSCGARSETFVRRPLDQFFFFFAELWGFPASSHPSPAASSKAGIGGGGLASRGWGTQCALRAPPSSSARPPAPTSPPPPRSRSLRKLRP